MTSWKKSHSKATRARKTKEISMPSHEEMQEGYIIQESRGEGYDVFQDGKSVIHAEDFDSALGQIRFQMAEHKFFPDIYYVNERGNTDLLDQNGKIVKSWV